MSHPQADESAREHDSFDELHKFYYQRVLAYCLRRVEHGEAQDLAAEVFAIAWRKRRAIPNGPEALPWLYAVARRVVSQHWRSSRRRRRLLKRLTGLGRTHSSDPLNRLMGDEDSRLVAHAAMSLRKEAQEVLRLRFWEELSYADISVVLGTTPDAARQRVHRAKRALAEAYRELGGRFPRPSIQPQERVTDET